MANTTINSFQNVHNGNCSLCTDRTIQKTLRCVTCSFEICSKHWSEHTKFCSTQSNVQVLDHASTHSYAQPDINETFRSLLLNYEGLTPSEKSAKIKEIWTQFVREQSLDLKKILFKDCDLYLTSTLIKIINKLTKHAEETKVEIDLYVKFLKTCGEWYKEAIGYTTEASILIELATAISEIYCTELYEIVDGIIWLKLIRKKLTTPEDYKRVTDLIIEAYSHHSVNFSLAHREMQKANQKHSLYPSQIMETYNRNYFVVVNKRKIWISNDSTSQNKTILQAFSEFPAEEEAFYERHAGGGCQVTEYVVKQKNKKPEMFIHRLYYDDFDNGSYDRFQLNADGLLQKQEVENSTLDHIEKIICAMPKACEYSVYACSNLLKINEALKRYSLSELTAQKCMKIWNNWTTTQLLSFKKLVKNPNHISPIIEKLAILQKYAKEHDDDELDLFTKFLETCLEFCKTAIEEAADENTLEIIAKSIQSCCYEPQQTQLLLDAVQKKSMHLKTPNNSQIPSQKKNSIQLTSSMLITYKLMN